MIPEMMLLVVVIVLSLLFVLSATLMAVVYGMPRLNEKLPPKPNERDRRSER